MLVWQVLREAPTHWQVYSLLTPFLYLTPGPRKRASQRRHIFVYSEVSAAPDDEASVYACFHCFRTYTS